jgi:hypothetical protein
MSLKNVCHFGNKVDLTEKQPLSKSKDNTVYTVASKKWQENYLHYHRPIIGNVWGNGTAGLQININQLSFNFHLWKNLRTWRRSTSFYQIKNVNINHKIPYIIALFPKENLIIRNIFFYFFRFPVNMTNRLVSIVVLMHTIFINVDVEITYITKRETIEDIILLNSAHHHTSTTKQCAYTAHPDTLNY